MLGGLARRVALVEKARSEGKTVLVVDSGDLFFEAPKGGEPAPALAKARLMAKAYRRMGAVAVNVGDLDLSHGLDFLRQEAAQGLPLISANLVDRVSQAPLFPPFVIQDVQGLRVAFLGLSHPQPAAEIGKALGEKVAVRDPVEAAREAMGKLKGRADLVVLLSDLGMGREQEVVRAVPGIHFVLGGHEGRFVSSPQQEGAAFVVQSYAKGMYLGQLRLKVEDPSSGFEDEGRGARIQQQIAGLEGRLRTLQKTHERQPSDALQRSIQQIRQQKEHLEKEIHETSQPVSGGNFFSWSLSSLDPALPEDEEVRSWIQMAGIDKD